MCYFTSIIVPRIIDLVDSDVIVNSNQPSVTLKLYYVVSKGQAQDNTEESCEIMAKSKHIIPIL